MNVSEKAYNAFKTARLKYFWYSFGLDLLGVASYLLPGLGEISDGFYAPFYGAMIFYMYKEKGKASATIGGVFGMVEEILPMTDVFPTATIMWFYHYVVKKDKTLKNIIK